MTTAPSRRPPTSWRRAETTVTVLVVILAAATVRPFTLPLPLWAAVLVSAALVAVVWFAVHTAAARIWRRALTELAGVA